MTNLSADSQHLGQDSNHTPPKYNSLSVTTTPNLPSSITVMATSSMLLSNCFLMQADSVKLKSSY